MLYSKWNHKTATVTDTAVPKIPVWFNKAPLHDEIKVCALSASIVIAYMFLEGKKEFQPLCLISSDTILQRINRRREFAVTVCRTMSGNFSVTA